MKCVHSTEKDIKNAENEMYRNYSLICHRFRVKQDGILKYNRRMRVDYTGLMFM